MVMGHVGFGETFDYFIHAFHMPMFFFVSGFLIKDNKIPFFSYLKKKAKSLLIPYFVFSAFHYALSPIIHGNFTYDSFWGLLFPDSLQIPIAGALWFLVALFFADIIYFWICRISDSSIQWIVVCSIAFIGQIVPARFFPFALGAAFVGVGLIHIGKTLQYYRNAITGLKTYQVLFFGVLLGYSIMKSGYINMRSGSYPDAFILFWVNAVCASIIGLNIAKIFKNLLGNRIVWCFESVGRNSIVYLCLNQIVILICRRIVSQVFHFINLPLEPLMIYRIIVLIFSLVVLFLLSVLFENTFLRVFIGRFRKN